MAIQTNADSRQGDSQAETQRWSGWDCDFVATGATREEVMRKVMEHGGIVHADLMKDMTPGQTADFVPKLEVSIKSV